MSVNARSKRVEKAITDTDLQAMIDQHSTCELCDAHGGVPAYCVLVVHLDLHHYHHHNRHRHTGITTQVTY